MQSRGTEPHSDAQTPEGSRRSGLCLHCKLPLLSSAYTTNLGYCCSGCQAASELIEAYDLERYYDLQDQTLSPKLERSLGVASSLLWVDKTATRVQVTSGRFLYELSAEIDGIVCAGCVWVIEELFRKKCDKGTIYINPTRGRVRILWDDSTLDLKEYLLELRKLGYTVTPPEEVRKENFDATLSLLIRFGILSAIAINSMLISLSFYLGLSADSPQLFSLFRWINLGLATFSMAIGAPIFLRSAIAGLRHGQVHLDLPIAAGICLAYLGSVSSFVLGETNADYFDTLNVFIALMVLGRWFLLKLSTHNQGHLALDDGLQSVTVTQLDKERRPHLVYASELEINDIVLISPGEMLLAGGWLHNREGATISLATINGESEPISLSTTEAVPAGAINSGSGPIEVVLNETVSASQLQENLAYTSIRESSDRLPDTNHFSTSYVLGVLTLTAMALYLHQGTGLPRALTIATSILVITCPCAFGILPPFIYELASNALRKRGVFLRNLSLFTHGQKIRHIVFDKTGTLTAGHLDLQRPSSLDNLDHHALHALSQLVFRSNHPRAVAIRDALSTSRPQLIEGASITEEPGKGLELVLNDSRWRFGLPSWALTRGDVSNFEGSTVLSNNSVLVATFRFNETPHPDALQTCEQLSSTGYKLHLASGDSTERVQGFCRALGFEFASQQGAMQSHQKADKVLDLDPTQVMMVGDGLNDAPAFSRAMLSAAPARAGATIAGRANLYLFHHGLMGLHHALAVAAFVRKLVFGVYAFGILYNAVAVTLAFQGMVSPLLAAIIMPTSTILLTSAVLFAFRCHEGQANLSLNGSPKPAFSRAPS